MVMGDIYMLMSFAEFKHLLEVGWWVALMEDKDHTVINS